MTCDASNVRDLHDAVRVEDEDLVSYAGRLTEYLFTHLEDMRLLFWTRLDEQAERELAPENITVDETANLNTIRSAQQAGLVDDTWDPDELLRGLAPRVVAEVIYALQERTRQEIQTRSHHLRPVCAAALACHAGSLQDIPVAELASVPSALHKSMVTLARRQQLNPETERVKDEWDVTTFGHSGTLKFTEISQPWLREATKRWAYDDLPRRRGADVVRVVQTQINSLVLLSDSLRLQRDDHGDRLAGLSRTDITAFCNRMAYCNNKACSAGTSGSTPAGTFGASSPGFGRSHRDRALPDRRRHHNRST